jgi:hypothetical protein
MKSARANAPNGTFQGRMMCVARCATFLVNNVKQRCGPEDRRRLDKGTSL